MAWDGPDDDFEAVPSAQWDEEEERAGDGVIDDWDAESGDEKSTEVATATKVTKPEGPAEAKPVKGKKLHQQKMLERSKRLDEEQKAKESVICQELSHEEIQRQLEASRLADAEDLFGDLNEPSKTKDISRSNTAAGGAEAPSDDTPLRTEQDYLQLARSVVARIDKEQRNNLKRMAFLKELFTLCAEKLKMEEINDIRSILTVAFNQKSRAKQAASKKKKGGKKNVNVGSGRIDDDNTPNDADMFDDFF